MSALEKIRNKYVIDRTNIEFCIVAASAEFPRHAAQAAAELERLLEKMSALTNDNDDPGPVHEFGPGA
jgi:hypothetical protein